MLMIDRGSEIGKGHVSSEQAAPGGTSQLTVVVQLGLQTEPAEDLPCLTKLVQQVLPSLCDRSTICIGQDRVLAAAVGREDELDAIGEDHFLGPGRRQGIPDSCQLRLQRPAALAK